MKEGRGGGANTLRSLDFHKLSFALLVLGSWLVLGSLVDLSLSPNSTLSSNLPSATPIL